MPGNGQELHASIAMYLLAQYQRRKSHKKDPMDEFARCALLQTAACSKDTCLKPRNVALGGNELIFVIVAFCNSVSWLRLVTYVQIS
mmetsp:Transcript_11073/g.68182  ORF Transcript_11073/g.68182 Transcript_11073/m.68182 type:complete len:87 (-) Transcript_11073:792-1052(-)